MVICPARGIERMRIPRDWRPALDEDRLLALAACGGNGDSGETPTCPPSSGRPTATTATGQDTTQPSSDEATAFPTTIARPPRKATSAESDRDALVALYNATGDESWDRNDEWLSDRPLREWNGVRTDESGRVIGLVLGNNKLSREIPPELGNLASLEWLTATTTS